MPIALSRSIGVNLGIVKQQCVIDDTLIDVYDSTLFNRQNAMIMLYTRINNLDIPLNL